MQNILMVCTGNICRSPIAEALLRHKLSERSSFSVQSAGTAALVDYQADKFAQQILWDTKKIDISNHRARQITFEILAKSDLVLVMETEHQKEIECQYPSICGRVHRLGKWSGYNIPDPYKRPIEAFEQTLALIEQCLNDWQARLWN